MQFNNSTSTKNVDNSTPKKMIGASPLRLGLPCVQRMWSIRGFLLIPLLFGCFALSPQARAVCQEGCDLTNLNTFLGDDALINNTTGDANTATGASALGNNTTGGGNTATGFAALVQNGAGNSNTATGFQALLSNSYGSLNTATGARALANNITGSDNTATGESALSLNITGNNNTATGFAALVTDRRQQHGRRFACAP